MGRNYWMEMPNEIKDARRIDTVVWWTVRTYDSEWEAKRAIISWVRERYGYRPPEELEPYIRSAMLAVRYKRFHRIRL